MEMDLRKKDTRLLHKMDAGWASMEMDKTARTFSCWAANHAEDEYGIR